MGLEEKISKYNQRKTLKKNKFGNNSPGKIS